MRCSAWGGTTQETEDQNRKSQKVGVAETKQLATGGALRPPSLSSPEVTRVG